MADRMAAPVRVAVDDLEDFVIRVLTKVGVSPDDARTTAQVLVTTDTWGVFTHGVKSLPGYVRRIQAGGIRADAVPKVTRQGAAWALVDGGSALGMVTSVMAMKEAMNKARASGIGYVGVRNSCHFGAAGYYAAMAAGQGMLGLAMANDAPSMTVPGARGRVMGNNPFAFAVPAGRHPPILLDMALSTVAGGKVMAAKALGQPVPEGWMVDREGRPSTDPTDFLERGGALLPMAGHKGYGLALMVETLSALVTGAAIRAEVLKWLVDDPSLPTGHGAAFLALDIEAMVPLDSMYRRMDQMIEEIRQSPRAPGAERVYLPGEMEWERRQKALAEGVLLPADVVPGLAALSEELQVELKGLPEG